MSARLSKEQAIQVKDQCLKAHKERLVERANIIQARFSQSPFASQPVQRALLNAKGHSRVKLSLR